MRKKTPTTTGPNSHGGDSPPVSCSLNSLHNRKRASWREGIRGCHRNIWRGDLNAHFRNDPRSTLCPPGPVQHRRRVDGCSPASRCPRRSRSRGPEQPPARLPRDAAVTSPGRPILSVLSPKYGVRAGERRRPWWSGGSGPGGGGAPWTPGLRTRWPAGRQGRPGVWMALPRPRSRRSTPAGSEHAALGSPRSLQTAGSLFSLSVLPPRRGPPGISAGTFQRHVMRLQYPQSVSERRSEPASQPASQPGTRRCPAPAGPARRPRNS